MQGPASLIADPEERAQARALALEPWAPVRGVHYVRIRSELVSGRRLPLAGGHACSAPAAWDRMLSPLGVS